MCPGGSPRRSESQFLTCTLFKGEEEREYIGASNIPCMVRLSEKAETLCPSYLVPTHLFTEGSIHRAGATLHTRRGPKIVADWAKDGLGTSLSLLVEYDKGPNLAPKKRRWGGQGASLTSCLSILCVARCPLYLELPASDSHNLVESLLYSQSLVTRVLREAVSKRLKIHQHLRGS